MNNPNNVPIERLQPDLTLTPNLVRGVFFALVTIVIWVGFIIIAKASSHGSLTGLDIAALRILGASIILLPLGFWINKNKNPIPHKDSVSKDSSFAGLSPLSFKLTATLGLSGGLLYAVLAYSGFFFAPASHAAVLLPGSLPLWTSLIAFFILNERIAKYRLFGLALILGGDLTVGGPSLVNAVGEQSIWRGDLLFILASIAWSYYAVMVRSRQVKPVYATTAITVFVFFTYLPSYIFLCMTGVLKTNIWETSLDTLLFQMFFQGVLSVVVSGITFNQMVRYFGPVRTTMMTAVVPALAALGASIYLDEHLSSNVIMGLILVTFGIFFGIGSRSVKARTT
jgi:drug/metabolite transporter (DMT)-like permease